MVEITCPNCGRTVEIENSAGPHQDCPHCGLPLPSGPPMEGDPPPNTGESSAAWILVGVIGGLVGFSAALGIGQLDQQMAVEVRGTVLGALAGVLLAPVFILGVFIRQLQFPLGWGGSGWINPWISEALWSRIARGVSERAYGQAATVVAGFVLLGMGIGGWIGSSAKTIPVTVVWLAALGATGLGAFLAVWACAVWSQTK